MMPKNGHLFVASQSKKSERARKINQATALILVAAFFSVSARSQLASLIEPTEANPASSGN
jgi:hypothetical protein